MVALDIADNQLVEFAVLYPAGAYSHLAVKQYNRPVSSLARQIFRSVYPSQFHYPLQIVI